MDTLLLLMVDPCPLIIEERLLRNACRPRELAIYYLRTQRKARTSAHSQDLSSHLSPS